MLTLPLIDDCYDTPPNSSIWPCNKIPTACFYPQAFYVIWQAAQMAKQGIYTDGDWAKSSFNIVKALERCGVQLQLRGMEHVLANTEPCVFIGNHMSTLETFVLPTLIPPYKPATFVIKQSLIDYPLFKHVMRSRNPVVVKRTNPREDLKTVLSQGCEKLEAGTSVIVFPQTTRTTTFDAEQFNSIGIKLARKAKVPIIPLALKTDAWSNGQRLKDFGPILADKKVHFKFGAPIDSSGNSKEIQETIIQFIQQNLSAWQR
ncbi:MAG: 1-acyl-sn-glycerol-3-phosphate acyltransferase [Desulfobacteraceae bacterium 4572_35.2]|nr:MAG: 1-acyl-sn-glycerol-3-phosphate acyltransferase [Desulfobacteraceae bacterium 4572_35.2]